MSSAPCFNLLSGRQLKITAMTLVVDAVKKNFYEDDCRKSVESSGYAVNLGGQLSLKGSAPPSQVAK